MIFPSSVTLPPRLRRPFALARALLLVLVISGAILLTIRSLFPTLSFGFDFRTPQSTRNNFLDPRSETAEPIENGKIPTTGVLLGNIGAYGAFDKGLVRIELEKKSGPAGTLDVAIRRGYRGAFFPFATEPANRPLRFLGHSGLFVDSAGHFYLVGTDGMSRRFVSEKAFRTRFDPAIATPLSDPTRELFTEHPLATEWAGFRPGTLLSFADGVFIVTSEREVRPFGDAEIFLKMGYRFEDVLAATAEEVGIYERGRIILAGAAHPDGTLFATDAGALFALDESELVLVTDDAVAARLLERQTPIRIDPATFGRVVRCSLRPAGWLDPRTYECPIDVSYLSDAAGSDFEVSLRSATPIDIRELRVTLRTARTEANLASFLGDIKRRLLSRFGYDS